MLILTTEVHVYINYLSIDVTKTILYLLFLLTEIIYFSYFKFIVLYHWRLVSIYIDITTDVIIISYIRYVLSLCNWRKFCKPKRLNFIVFYINWLIFFFDYYIVFMYLMLILI